MPSPQPSKLQASAWRHDAYLSFSDADRGWVEEQLIPRLHDAGRRLSFEQTLPLGGYEVVERGQAIATSRKTLAVLSEDFLHHQWSTLESAMVVELDPAARKRRLIPVLRGGPEIPLRLRPLVAVDLRPTRRFADGDPQQWQRLIDATDPQVPDDEVGAVQGLSLLLANATADLPRPTWTPGGVAWLATTYALWISTTALIALALWQAPAVRDALAVLVLAPTHGLMALVWREDRDLGRRLGHLLKRRKGLQTVLALGVLASVLLWGRWGVVEAKEVVCGPLGCPEPGTLYVAMDPFEVDATTAHPQAAIWAANMNDLLTQRLSEVDGLSVSRLEGVPRHAQTALQRRLDYRIAARLTPGGVTAALWDNRWQAAPPAVTVRGPASNDDEVLALQDALTEGLLERLGFELDPAQRARLRQIPSDDARALQLNAEGHRLLVAERYEEAYAKLDAAVTRDPDYSIAWSNLGELAWRLGSYDDALKFRTQAAELLPSYAPLHYNLGHLLAEMGRDDEALKALELAIELDHAHRQAYNELGKLRLRRGEADAAIEALRQSVSCDATFAAAWKNLGHALLTAGRLGEAIDTLQTALQNYRPVDVLGRSEALALLVQAQVQTRDVDDACFTVQRLRRLDPGGVLPFTLAAEDALVGRPCPTHPTLEDSHV